MSHRGIFSLIGALLLAGTSPAPAAAPASVCVIQIHEDITHNTLYLVRRGLQEATAKRAVAVVLDMDTNGGRVDVTESIIALLNRAPLKTYTYVSAKAYSAGAFIAAGTEAIYMAPGSVIGAATPVMMIPGQGVAELPKSFEEKLNSAMRALIRSTAQQKGHNPDVFEAMVDSDKELVIDGTTINPKGKLLTLTNEEAARAYGEPPRPLLSAGTVATLDAVLSEVGLAGAEVLRVEPYGFEVLGRWLTMISPLLILIGMVAIYVELKAPGLGVAAVVAAVAFGLYFLGTIAAGLAGWEMVALFLVGVVLLAVEVLVIPGFGVAGVVGIGVMALALVLATAERWPGATWPDWTQWQPAFIRVGFGLGGAVVAGALLARWLPQSSLFRRLELSATLDAARTSGDPAAGLLGRDGTAETVLRPAGKGRFDGQLVDVVTDGDFIVQGERIKIIAVEGSRVVVTKWTSN